ncbi:aminotransferase class I/II-fold pyridoxal phosphate-dependent enzyme [Hydrogenophaga sp.]|uniref:aminotransferase class I/II-fold pyridoxal phosphate-dependent enzyme n=1 Tax=Hydrogenophaga sp. TaxID=1904254 RepID=UPI002612C65C|nr:aminotransferase class I/II-fold pyridoxal phosphate-dependent enzyme [Hydrogenophaga sp.]MCW5652737.1 aminotransferase class I/II-fold pyridoxal phosphate-dependent enzyme [Hydrogenophaga sp.]
MKRLHGGPDTLGVPAWDFSTNANACGPCPLALMAVQQADARRYPDPAYTRLREALAAFHAVDARRIVLAGSASEFIARITAWVAREGGRRVWLPSLAYGDYAAAAQTWRLEPVADGAQAALAWLCEPASPLGGGEPEARRVAASGAVVVLDRAYEPLRLEGAGSLAEADLAKVWQLWSPNKALGLTGVRGAYAIAPDQALPQAMALDAMAPSWPLGAHAVAMLEAWRRPQVQDWLAQSRAQLRAWKSAQLQWLSDLGWPCLPSQANYFCARAPVPPDVGALRAVGIKLRDARSFGLPGHWRLSVQPPAAQAVLRAALLAQREAVA